MTASTSLDQVKSLVEKLPLREQFELLEWLDALANEGWDRQMAEDAAAGKLDAAIARSEEHERAGRVRPWP